MPTPSFQVAAALAVLWIGPTALQAQSWRSHYKAGLSDYRSALYCEAEEHFKRALKTAEESEHSTGVIETSARLGIMYRSLGRYGDAELAYARVLKKLKARYGEDHVYTVGAHNSLGALYKSLAQFELARKSYRRAIELYEKTSDDRLDRTVFETTTPLVWQTWRSSMPSWLVSKLASQAKSMRRQSNGS